MKTYPQEQIATALKFVEGQVKKEIQNRPDMDGRPPEQAAAIMEPVTLGLKLLALLDEPTALALVMRKFGGANPADGNYIRDFLDKIPGLFETQRAPA